MPKFSTLSQDIERVKLLQQIKQDMLIPTVEDKYKFLLSLLRVTDVDAWENDALLAMEAQYIQFSNTEQLKDIDAIVGNLLWQSKKGEL